MQKKTDKIGSCQEGSANKCLIFLFVLCFTHIPTLIWSQNQNTLSLPQALLDLAKQEKVSIVFSTDNIPAKNVIPLIGEHSIQKQLTYLLRDTDLYFELRDNQVFLFKKYKIFGFIEDAETGEKLISATIYKPEIEDYEVSNNYGYFSISTKMDSLPLEVSYVGYKTKQLVFGPDDMNKAINIALEQDASLNEILITDKLVSKDDRKYIELDKGSDILLTENQAITALGGEPDIFQTLVRQSGISSGTDGIGGIHVRGGKNDQNLILLDGVKLYNAAHSFGMFSIVSSSIVDQIRLHKTGAAGAATGRLSSVLDIRTKDPNLNSAQGQIQFSTLAGQATTEIPIIKNKLGLLLSGRKTHIDPYVNHVTKKRVDGFEIPGQSSYGFYDINMKLYARLNTKNKLYFTLYQGRDNYTDEYKDDFLDEEPAYFYDQDLFYKWKNKFATLRWNSLIGKNSFVNLQFSGYQYDYRNKFALDLYDEYFEDFPSFSQYITFNSQTTNYEIKLDFETILTNHHLKYGVNVSQNSYQIGEVVDTMLESSNLQFLNLENNELIPITFLGYGSREMTLYLSDKIKLSNDWLLEGGIYQTVQRADDAGFALDPIYGTSGYVKTLKKVSPDIYIGGSVGSFIQTEHLLTTADNGYPNDIWVPSTDNVPFQRSNQIEVFSEIESGGHSIRLSTYYKHQTGLLRYIDYARLPSLVDLFSESWEFDVALGDARGYGIELDYGFKLENKFSLHAVYTYGNMEYQFDEINLGEPFPFDYSIPHTISIGSNIRLNAKWHLVIDWFYASGKPYTLYEADEFYTPLDINGLYDSFSGLSNENEFRQPNVHKLSAMLNAHWKWASIQNNFSIGVQNIYNRSNPILQYQLENGEIRSQQGFPILPMFLWRVQF